MRRGQSVSSQLLTSRGDSSACRCECRGGRRRNMEKKQVVEEEHAPETDFMVCSERLLHSAAVFIA